MHDDIDIIASVAARPRTRAELEAEFGQVWDEHELARDFETTAIIPPTFIVRLRTDGTVGSVLLQARPRLYFRFKPSPEQEK